MFDLPDASGIFLQLCGIPLFFILLGIAIIRKEKSNEEAKEAQESAARQATWKSSPEGQAEIRHQQLEEQLHNYLLSIKPPEIIKVVNQPEPLNLNTSEYRSRGNTGQHRKSADDAWDNVHSFVQSQAEYNKRETARFEAETQAWQEYCDHVSKYQQIYKQWGETKWRVVTEWERKHGVKFSTPMSYYDE